MSVEARVAVIDEPLENNADEGQPSMLTEARQEELERRLESVTTITKIVAYRQVDREKPSEEFRDALIQGGNDWVVFTSSNTSSAHVSFPSHT